MEKKKLPLSRRVSLGAMAAALTLLFLYASEVLTGFRFLCAALSGLFIVVLTQEDLFGTAWLCFLTVSVLGFLLCPDRMSWFLYVTLIGHYGIVRRFFQKFITVPAVRSLFTVLYCNLGALLGLWAMYAVAGVDVVSFLPDIPVVVLVLIVEAVFFLLDILFEAAANIYQKRVRRFLLR